MDKILEKEQHKKFTSPALVAQRFLAKNQKTLSTSRSTPSLPDLVNYAITSATASLASKRQVVDFSTAMRRGYSQQATQVSAKLSEQPKKQTITKRRHSYSSFLDAKYGKAAIVDEETRNYKKSFIASTPTNTHFSSSTTTIGEGVGGPGQKALKGKKGHRPRSYSEVSFNLPHAERAPPVAITNKTPAYEYYGFVMYLASFVVFGIYLIWAYVPDEILHSLGITYYPNRYWALAIPIWLMTVIWFIFFSFISINLMNTAPFNSYHCITDEHANLMRMDREIIKDRPSDWMPELYDIPIGLVNTILYYNEQADKMTQKYVIPTSSSRHHHLYKNTKKNSTSSILNDTNTTATDEMTEKDALALKRRNSNSNSVKRYYKK